MLQEKPGAGLGPESQEFRYLERGDPIDSLTVDLRILTVVTSMSSVSRLEILTT